MNQISTTTAFVRPYLPIVCSPSEASRVLADLDMRPPTPERVTSWLQPVLRAVTNPPPPRELNERVRAIMLACQGLPAWAFSPATAAEAVRKFKFWPAAAEVYDLVHGDVADDLARVGLLRQAAAKLGATVERQQTAEEREAARQHVARTLAALKAEMAGRERDKPSAPTRMAPTLSRATLNEIYRREGLVAPSVPTDARNEGVGAR